MISHILRELNSIIVLLFIGNISHSDETRINFRQENAS